MLFSPLCYFVPETEIAQLILDSRRGFEILESKSSSSKITPSQTPPLPPTSQQPPGRWPCRGSQPGPLLQRTLITLNPLTIHSFLLLLPPQKKMHYSSITFLLSPFVFYQYCRLSSMLSHRLRYWLF